MLKTDFDKAVKELETFLIIMESDLRYQGWTYFTAWKAPGTFKELLHAYRVNGRNLIIEEDGCDHTIFSSPRFNHLLRFWHDVTHLTTMQDFSMAGERIVIDRQLHQAETMGVSKPALAVLKADLLGQLMYYEVHGEFVKYQNAFVNSCMQKGIKIACMVKH